MVGLQRHGELDLQLAGKGQHGTEGAAGQDNAPTIQHLVKADAGIETPEVQCDGCHKGRSVTLANPATLHLGSLLGSLICLDHGHLVVIPVARALPVHEVKDSEDPSDEVCGLLVKDHRRSIAIKSLICLFHGSSLLLHSLSKQILDIIIVLRVEDHFIPLGQGSCSCQHLCTGVEVAVV